MLAGAVEGDDDFFVGEAKLFEGYVGAVGPGAVVVGVEGDYKVLVSRLGLLDGWITERMYF